MAMGNPHMMKMGGPAAMKNPDLSMESGANVSVKDSIKSHAMKMEKMESKVMTSPMPNLDEPPPPDTDV